MQAKQWFNEFKVTFSDKSVVYAGIDAVILGVCCRTIKMKIEIKFRESQIELYFIFYLAGIQLNLCNGHSSILCATAT